MSATSTVTNAVQYVSDEEGNAVGVIVPIEMWREMESECETARILSNPVMRKRLLEALHSTEDIPFEVVRAKLGL